uniref:NADH dehydrogenase subunit 5 n=1 Tax=Simocephalus serrulatus TaxID=117539 RepID=UPI001EDD1626|nr:NADH dehydrogenase subunit 5 [Simocephalus serrulatus]UKB87189.1 NADH dehydrogenase subunit 5 [Simocephalus serrulatus]
MTSWLYKNISFFLMNLTLGCFISSIYFMWNSKVVFLEWILGSGGVNFSATFLFDYMSLLFLATVFCISSNVVWYSRSYMNNDKDAERFILLVFGFVISMMFLIISPNVMSILLGWDGLGLISYCLVVYYPTKKSSSAGMLTVLSNRVGDICILISIAWFAILGDFNFLVWNNSSELFLNYWLPFLMILGAMTKSAQIPFSAWLPAAMAAPTPVSALVHSSTLVTAGVYLLIRFSFLLESWSGMLLLLSTLTMFMSGIVAVYEYDLKKIIALSTLSQLGVMMFSISLGLYSVAFFHLVTHALFKALLFLSAGALIHGVGGSQDIRHFGGLAKSFPLVGVCLNLANLSLCGIPFMSGFYSKDLIVELACQSSWNLFIMFIMIISLGLTVAYSVRLVYYSFINNSGNSPFLATCDIDYTMLIPICTLSIISLFSGPSINWTMFSYSSLILLPLSLKFAALFMITLSTILMMSLNFFNLKLLNFSSKISFFMGSMWFLPLISGQSISLPILVTGGQILKNIDQGWLELNTKNIYFSYSCYFNKIMLTLQSNSLKTHFLVFLMWLFFLGAYLI